jgi:hypothetical protein
MVIGFCEEVGLPTNLLDLGIEKLTEEKIMKAAEASFAEGVPEEQSGAPLFFVVNFKLCYNKIRVIVDGR